MLFALALVAGLAGAPPTGSSLELLHQCRHAATPAKASTVDEMNDVIGCLSFVRGVTEAHEVIASAMPTAKRWCVPAGATVEQRVRVVVAWLEKNPAKLHDPAVLAVFAAHVEAFKCTSKTGTWLDEYPDEPTKPKPAPKDKRTPDLTL